MKKLGILTMYAAIIGLIACNGQNDKKNRDNISNTTETQSGDRENQTPVRGQGTDAASTSMEWGNYYDTNMDISPYYGNLEMTDRQIKDYESFTKNRRDNWSKGNNLEADKQAILIQRDSSLKSVLSPEQYKKYKEMANKRNNGNK
ncbi:MAG TPA: hypothetical protein VKZ93_00725 [Arenibacter sp.]|nr:hypothetical protein [Arenibacter sp.]